MFTGIIESLGKVSGIEKQASNVSLTVESEISNCLKVDQSVAHNGVCLTVVKVTEKSHQVTIIQESLKKSNMGKLQIGDKVNLERCMLTDGRFDGHIVQGHVDQTGECLSIDDRNGSKIYTFKYKPNRENLVVEKGSVCINGVSLTAFDSSNETFSVAIIPFTFQNTNFKFLKSGNNVNIEFDIIGKYVARILSVENKI